MKDDEFEIIDYQGNLKYDVSIGKKNNYYSYSIESYDE